MTKRDPDLAKNLRAIVEECLKHVEDADLPDFVEFTRSNGVGEIDCADTAMCHATVSTESPTDSEKGSTSFSLKDDGSLSLFVETKGNFESSSNSVECEADFVTIVVAGDGAGRALATSLLLAGAKILQQMARNRRAQQKNLPKPEEPQGAQGGRYMDLRAHYSVGSTKKEV